MRNALLAGGLALLSLIAPSCVDTALTDEAAADAAGAADAADAALLEAESDEVLGGDVPGPLDVRLQHAVDATPLGTAPAPRSKATQAATIVETDAAADADTAADADPDTDTAEDGESSVSGSGDGRVIVKK